MLSNLHYHVRHKECTQMYLCMIRLRRLLVVVRLRWGVDHFLPAWRNEQGELVESGRMNLGVVTLNLPRVALESKGIKKSFGIFLKKD